jgi:hypothetical protein
VPSKIIKNKETVTGDTRAKLPEVIIFDEKSNKPVSLILLGVIAIILGLLSTTPLMAKTIFSESADFIIGFGIVGIIVGLIINNRQKIQSFFGSNKKEK